MGMCYGNLDPKFVLQDAEARLKGISFQCIDETVPAAGPAPGLGTWLRAALARLNWKDKAHV
jgi:hypothetical protein